MTAPHQTESLSATLPEKLHFFSSSLTNMPLRHIGIRHTADGVFLKEPGNTVVCHLVKDSLSARAVMEARTRMQSLPEAEKLAYTPESSLHMTLFQGIIEGRRSLPYWPEDLALDSPIDAMTEAYIERLSGFEAPGTFRIEVVGATPNGLSVAGVSEKDRQMMKIWRDQLAAIFGYRHPDHETYEFHITFAYILERFSDEAILTWDKALKEIVEDLREAAPIIELVPPAFCSFEDMNHFEELVVMA